MKKAVVILAAVLAGCVLVLPQSSAAAPKIALSKLHAPKKMTIDSRYTVSGRLTNRKSRSVKGPVKVSFSTVNGKLGPYIIGKRTFKVKKKSRRQFKVPITAKAPYGPGAILVVACFKGSCKTKRTTLVEKTGPTGPTGPTEPQDPGAPFVVGAPSAGDALFPVIGNGGYDATNYDIHLDYNPISNVFNPGTYSTMTATATDDLWKFSLDFQGPEIESVEVNGTPSFYERDETKLIVAPPDPISDGDSFEVTVHYDGYVNHITDPDDSREGWVRACRSGDPSPTQTDCFGSFTVSEPVGAESWFPNNNIPADKATFDTTTKVPTEAGANAWTALGTGEFMSKIANAGTGKTTWKWRETLPTSTYLTTGSVGRYSYTVGSMIDTSNNATIPLYNAYDLSANPAEVLSMTTAFAAQSPIINQFSSLFGPYPLNSGGLLGAKTTGVGYYLENQGKIHSPSPSIPLDVLAHEVVHQWFGDAVGPKSWNQIWFNEGWAQWGEWYYGSPATPAAQFTLIYATAEESDWDIPPGTLLNDPANLFAEFPTYTRPGMMIEGYRQIVGDTKFFDFAKQLQTAFAYSTVDTSDFIDLALIESGFSGAELTLLGDYFDQWLFSTDKPTITPASFP
ncbi:MAG: M1 family metallopeptidase [Thermoleophilia bacterium]|nr:M1 family metallopeptidase [Thermoleophilia bacterium]